MFIEIHECALYDWYIKEPICKIWKWITVLNVEIGIFHGVTARNVCELLREINKNEFKYVGIDLFGQKSSEDEVVPDYLKKQKFSNN